MHPSLLLQCGHCHSRGLPFRHLLQWCRPPRCHRLQPLPRRVLLLRHGNLRRLADCLPRRLLLSERDRHRCLSRCMPYRPLLPSGINHPYSLCSRILHGYTSAISLPSMRSRQLLSVQVHRYDGGWLWLHRELCQDGVSLALLARYLQECLLEHSLRHLRCRLLLQRLGHLGTAHSC